MQKNKPSKKRMGAPIKNEREKVSSNQAHITLTHDEKMWAKEVAIQLNTKVSPLVRAIFLQWKKLRERDKEAANKFYSSDDFTVS